MFKRWVLLVYGHVVKYDAGGMYVAGGIKGRILYKNIMLHGMIEEHQRCVMHHST
jgi:hypothetical protein|tara:strand:- start:510 stop:674 length:165 start_codon:yes stop_codon:yes gene_type:complete